MAIERRCLRNFAIVSLLKCNNIWSLKECVCDNMALEISVLSTVDENTRATVEKAFWGYDGAQRDLFDVDLNHYWMFYQDECAKALHGAGQHIATRTHKDIVDCVQMLHSGTERHLVKDRLRSRLTTLHDNENEILDNSIDLAASLLTMVNFCSYSYGFSGRRWLSWANGGSLHADLRDFFFDNGTEASKVSVKLEKIFTAHNLIRIAGLEIIWTDNLLDHMRLTDDDQRVHIFHHASFLEVQKQR